MPAPVAAAPAIPLTVQGIGSAIGFAGDIVGGLFGSKKGKKTRELIRETNAQNAALAREANAQNYKMHQENLSAQERAARNSIAWRVEDAQKAGIHPLYAMGNPGISVSPTGAFASPATMQAPIDDYDPGQTISNMGQNISRAVNSIRSKEERVTAAVQAAQQARFNDLSAKKLEAEIMLLNSETARNQKDQIGPPMPAISAAQANDMARVKYTTNQIGHSAEDNRARSAGTLTDYQFVATDSGIARVPSKDIKERIEENMVLEHGWNVRNLFGPAVQGGGPKPPQSEFPLPPGFRWDWNWMTQTFQPVRVNRPRSNNAVGRRKGN